jgi:23S rRNA pseudouridine1911/1915/1917 synthase
MNKDTIELIAPEEYHLSRIDKFLAYSSELDFSRSYIQKLIKNSSIKVNDEQCKSNYKIKTDDIIHIDIPEPVKLDLTPEDIPLNILYQDASIVVINKAPGIVIHPGPGNWESTLVHSLLFHIKDLSSIGDVIRPGIVHRLDKDTSGVMIVAKNDISHRNLVEQFSNREVKKKYIALISGKPPKDHDTINLPIRRHPKYRHKMTVMEGGKESITEYKVINRWNTNKGIFSLLEIDLHTGRTHQIRVHLSSMGNPIIGDPIYSKKWEKHKVPYLLLASVSIKFKHPENSDKMKFNIEYPYHIDAFIKKLDSKILL